MSDASRLEPDVFDAHRSFGETMLLSIAISLKHIADKLDEISDILEADLIAKHGTNTDESTEKER